MKSLRLHSRTAFLSLLLCLTLAPIASSLSAAQNAPTAPISTANLQDLEAAARREPTHTRWLRVAEACPDHLCRFYALQQAQALAPADSKVLLAFAEYYVSREQNEKARDLLLRVTSAGPSNFLARKLLADLYQQAGTNNLALAEYRRLEHDFPGETTLQASIADAYRKLGVLPARAEKEFIGRKRDESARLLAAWQGSTAASDADTQYLVRLEALNAKRTLAAANATALADIRIDHVQLNGLFSTHVQQFFRIENEQGAREFSIRKVQYAPASEALRILHARVHKSDGRVLEAGDAGENPVADTSVAMYYDVRARAMRFPGVEPGDVVELEYRITPTLETNPYGDYFGTLHLFRTSLPTALKRYVVIVPASRSLQVEEVRMAAKAQLTEASGERVYQWTATDVAALPNEPRGPSATTIAPYIHASTFADWKELGAWYAELLRPQFELDSALHEIAARITRENPDELARIRAVHQLVLRSTHYVALEFGVYSYKPYSVSQTYARRFGDCKDKASLMIALLREVGVDAELALVRTRRLGDIDEHVASVAPFNHAIVYLPKYQLWLDGTAEYSGARELPLEDQGATAVTISSNGDATVRHIPLTTAEDNFTHRTLRAELKRDGTIEFSGETYTRGENAPGLRREYEVAERQRDAVRQPLAEVFPTVRLDRVEVQGASDLEKDVHVSFRGVLDSFAGKTTVVLNNSWMARKYLSTLAPLGLRTQDLLLPAQWETEEELHFALPAGAKVAALPQDTHIETAFGSSNLTYQQRGREIVVRNHVQLRSIRVTPDEYAAFRDFCSRTERAFRQEIKVYLR